MHEPIITEELFDKVQKQRNKNKSIKRKKHEWILNGLVKCKECGAKMTLKVEYKRDNSNELKSKKICCLDGLKRYRGKVCIRGSKGLDEEVLNKIVHIKLKEIIEQLDKKKIKSLILETENISEKSNDIQLLNKEFKKIEDELKVLYLDYKDDLLDREDYKKYYSEKSNERKRLKNELERLEKQKSCKPKITEDKIKELILGIKNFSKEIIFEIVDNIEIDNDNKIYIYYKYNVLGW